MIWKTTKFASGRQLEQADHLTVVESQGESPPTWTSAMPLVCSLSECLSWSPLVSAGAGGGPGLRGRLPALMALLCPCLACRERGSPCRLVDGRCLAGSSVRLSLLLPLGDRGSFLLHSSRCNVCVWSPAFLIFSAGQLVLLRNRTFCLCLKSGPTEDMEGLPSRRGGKESTCQCRRCKRPWVQPLEQKDALEQEMATRSSVLA